MALKDVKKGDKVIMRLFTGAFSGVKEVEKVDKTGIYITTRKGLSKFSVKTGKMVEPAPKSEKYANTIEEYDEEVAAAEMAKKSSKKKPEPAPKKKKDEEIEEIEDDAEEEAPKKPAKKVKKVVKKHVDEDDDVEEL